VSHPKILQSLTQLTEAQSYIKEVVSKSQTQHFGAGLVETDYSQVLPSLPTLNKSHFDIL
jgi:hypothetical protein